MSSPEIGLKEKRLQLVQQILIDQLFPQEEPIHLLHKTLVCFRESRFSFSKKPTSAFPLGQHDDPNLTQVRQNQMDPISATR